MDNPQGTQSSPTSTVQGQSIDKSGWVALALVWIYPIGVILMWSWMKHWRKLIKILISIPVIFFILGILGAIFVAAINPKGKIDRAIQQNEERIETIELKNR